MLLYLIRHAEAVERDPSGGLHDFDRALTAGGREQARALGEAFARLKLPLDVMVASPLVRAHQTAVEMLTALRSDLRPVTCDALAPERLKPGKLSDFLAAVSGEHVAAVGHMPELGSYVEWLLGAADGSVPLEKAAAVCIAFKGDPEKAGGKLKWAVAPDWFM